MAIQKIIHNGGVNQHVLMNNNGHMLHPLPCLAIHQLWGRVHTMHPSTPKGLMHNVLMNKAQELKLLQLFFLFCGR